MSSGTTADASQNLTSLPRARHAELPRYRPAPSVRAPTDRGDVHRGDASDDERFRDARVRRAAIPGRARPPWQPERYARPEPFDRGSVPLRRASRARAAQKDDSSSRISWRVSCGYDSHISGQTSIFARACYVFWITIFGNFDEKSSAFFATDMATLRAIALYACATAPSGSAITVGRPESACSRIWMSSGRLPRNGTL